MEALHNSILFRVIVVALVVLFAIGILSVGAAAVDESSIIEISPNGWTDVYNDPSAPADASTAWIGFLNESSDPFYFAMVNIDGTVRSIVFNPLGSYSSIKYSYNGHDNNKNSISAYTVTVDSVSYSYGRVSNSAHSKYFPPDSVFSSFSDFLIALDLKLTPPVVGASGSFSLPCGNVAYVEVSEASRLYLSATFENKSSYSGDWNHMTIQTGSGFSLPSAGTSYPLSGMSPANFRISGDTDLFGRTTSGRAWVDGSSYIVIYNPAYQQYGQGNQYILNPTITVSGDNIVDVKIFPLSGSVVVGTGISSWSDSDYSDYFSGSVDPETGSISFVDQNGNPGSPIRGGTSDISSNDETLGSFVKGILDDLISRIEGLFNITHNAIAQLVAKGSAFMTSLSGLYSWLPPAVFGVLSSAVILVITIGVLKVFL